ncbi:hypothetical protein BDN72DRAFT_865465 [Pluteus cervinus]|uniref:Uncharacterized protein n=1 Tax=Pluteus cervinus TaxID=181527 RepID=A0ACD3A078_9AGAR|nr:hypothetical protein BDN72DRAFT_865465 [Pluteus cervinus]
MRVSMVIPKRLTLGRVLMSKRGREHSGPPSENDGVVKPGDDVTHNVTERSQRKAKKNIPSQKISFFRNSPLGRAGNAYGCRACIVRTVCLSNPRRRLRLEKELTANRPVWLKCQTRTNHGNSDNKKNDTPPGQNSRPGQDLASKSTGMTSRFYWHPTCYWSVYSRVLSSVRTSISTVVDPFPRNSGHNLGIENTLQLERVQVLISNLDSWGLCQIRLISARLSTPRWAVPSLNPASASGIRYVFDMFLVRTQFKIWQNTRKQRGPGKQIICIRNTLAKTHSSLKERGGTPNDPEKKEFRTRTRIFE